MKIVNSIGYFKIMCVCFIHCLIIIVFAITDASALTLSESKHLLSRTGFGGSLSEIKQLLPLNRQQSIEFLLNGIQTRPQNPPSDNISRIPSNVVRLKQAGPDEKKKFRKAQRKRALELQAWWFDEMLRTHSPLTEKMVLFWHNHFVSAINKVKFSVLMYRQQLLFRQYGLGNYRSMLKGIIRDPAMILYLDGQKNKKDHPNENFARELLELFTLGEGHYTEQDIKEVARAFTGWSVNRKTGEFQFRRRQHDWGEKEFLGKKGFLNGDDIINIILSNSASSQWITKKLWLEFISDTPDPEKIKLWASEFEQSDFEIKPLLRRILNSDDFWAEENRGQMIKSPVELLVGLLRFFGIKKMNTQLLAHATKSLGQTLFNPPNVKGWVGGISWITSATLIKRQQLVNHFARGRGMKKANISVSGIEKVVKELRNFSKNNKTIESLFLVIPGNNLMIEADLELAIIDWLNDPVYQLK